MKPAGFGLVALVFERIGASQVSERITDFSTDQGRRLRNEIGDLPIGPVPFGCNRLIVTYWISLPPRVRRASFRHSASSHSPLLVGICFKCHRFLPMPRRCRRCNALAM